MHWGMMFAIPVLELLGIWAGYTMGLERGRNELCAVARECPEGTTAKFVDAGCLCVERKRQ